MQFKRINKILSLFMTVCLVLGMMPPAVVSANTKTAAASGISGDSKNATPSDAERPESEPPQNTGTPQEPTDAAPPDTGTPQGTPNTQETPDPEAPTLPSQTPENPGNSPVRTEEPIITSFDPLPDEILYQGYDYGEVQSQTDLALPGTLTGTDADDTPITIEGITWQSAPAFDPEVSAWYEFTPVFPTSFILADDLTVPVISVFIRPQGGMQIQTRNGNYDYEIDLNDIKTEPDPDTDGYSVSNGGQSIVLYQPNKTYYVTGTTTAYNLWIGNSAYGISLTLDDADLSTSESAGLYLQSDTNLTLLGENHLTGSNSGINGGSYSLTIDGTGSLTTSGKNIISINAFTINEGIVTAGYLSANTIEITGGTVNTAGTGGDPAIHTHEGITISGGTVSAVNSGANSWGYGIVDDSNSVTITGGSIYAKGNADSAYPIDPQPTDDNNIPLYMTTLAGLPADTEITNLTAPSGYGTADMYTDSSGKLYLWLPEGSQTITFEAGSEQVDKTITVAPNNKNLFPDNGPAAYTATLNIYKNDAPLPNDGTWVQLKLDGSETTTVNMPYNETTTRTASVPNGTWKVYYGNTYTGVNIGINNAPGQARLDIYDINYETKPQGTAAGGKLLPVITGADGNTYDMSAVPSDHFICFKGEAVTFNAAGQGAESYTYAWSGSHGETPISTTGDTFTIPSVNGKINLTCTITGTGAVTGTMNIGGQTDVALTTDAGSLLTDGWAWNAQTATLTLDSSYSGNDNGIYIQCGQSDNINLVLTGDVTINSNFWGINVVGINSSDTGGSLTIKAGSHTLNVISGGDALQAHNGVFIESGTVLAQGNVHGIVSYYGDVTVHGSSNVTAAATHIWSNGIQADGNVIISTTGKVEAVGEMGGIVASSMQGTSGILISSGTVKAKGTTNGALLSDSGTIITGGTVITGDPNASNGNVYGELTVDGTADVTVNGSITNGGSLTVSSGTVNITGTVEGSTTHTDGTLNGNPPNGGTITTHLVTVTDGAGGGHYAPGQTVTITADTPPEGKRFKSWSASPEVTFTGNNGASSSTATFIMPDCEVVIQAQFEPIPSAISSVTVTPAKVTINTGGSYTFSVVVKGTNTPSQSVIWTVEGQNSPDTTINGGNLTVASGETAGTLTVRATSAVDASKSGTALVMVNQPVLPLTYEIAFHANGGTGSPASMQTGTDGKLSSLPVLVRNGYTFDGWFTAANGGSAITVNTVFKADSTVYAHWTEKNSNTGDSSGSSTSSVSTSNTTQEKKPDQPVIAEIPVTAVADTDHSANAVIPDKAIIDAIANAQAKAGTNAQGSSANGIIIKSNITIPQGADSFSAVLTQTALQNLVSAGVAGFEITGGPVSLGLDSAALQEILKQGSDSITISFTPVSGLSGEALALIGSRPVYDITISYLKDGKTETITSLGNGTAALKIPYTPGNDEAPGYLFGVYVNTDGKAVRINSSAYDANSKSIIIDSSHLSIYGIGYEEPGTAFTDIENHWAKESIDYVTGRGLFLNTSETTFLPDAALSRGTLAAALGRLAEADTKLYTTSSFSDVAAEAAYRPYVEWAYKNNIMQAVADGKFEPDSPVTREEIAAILTSFAKASGCKLPATRERTIYADSASIGTAYKEAVTTMGQAGVIMGGSGNKFNPKSNVTRAEASIMLHRYIKLLIDPDTTRGWALNDAGQYLYYKDGRIITGWQIINGVKYYFYSDGILAVSTTVDGYEIGADGVSKNK